MTTPHPTKAELIAEFDALPTIQIEQRDGSKTHLVDGAAARIFLEAALDRYGETVREEACRRVARDMWYESRGAEERLKRVLDSILDSPTT